MQLLEQDDTGEFRLTMHLPNDAIPEIPPYAILSHTWGDEEVLFKDLADGTAKNKAGYAKIRFCGEQAERDGLKYFWVDTCCIDKSDAAELQDALNSMFQWYRNAAKCYVYLTDVAAYQGNDDSNSTWELAFRSCRWLTRGWTLQELIAPATVEFFSVEGVLLGDKQSLGHQIHNVTGIPLGALQSNALSDFSIEERMSWVKNRNTTRKEDKAYSLFGIFDVCMPILYGEGEDRAFKRLREEIAKDDRYLANLHATDPRLDKKRIEEAKGGLLINAYRWVLDSPDFRQWHNRSESRLLWIKGDPGKGKTMLLCGIINELEQAIVAEGYCHNLAYFFCQAPDSRINNATAVLRGLTYLLARQQPRLLSHIRKYIDAGKSLSDANAWIAISDILGEMLQDPNFKTTYLVVDALDECIIDLPMLLGFVVRISSDRVKWLLTSRNEITIERKLGADDGRTRLSLELKENAMQVSHAVNMYIDNRLSGLEPLQDDTILEDGALLKDRVRDILRDKASGTFLWVALVIQELSRADVESWHVLKIVEEMPPGLDGMYDRMLNEIKRYKRDSDFCRRILSVATVAYRPLLLTEIRGLSGLPVHIPKSTENIRKLVAKCGSFLTVRDDRIYLIHQTAKDYLSTKATTFLFPSGVGETHYSIYNHSLGSMSSRLRRDMYGLLSPGFPIEEVKPPNPNPLEPVGYSCVYWIDHLYMAKMSNYQYLCDLEDGGKVHQFVQHLFLYWLEALSLLKAMSDGVLGVTKLESMLLAKSPMSQLLDLLRDARRFLLHNKWAIETTPLQTYVSALLFSPTHSLIRCLYEKEEPRWITTKPMMARNWDACLQTLEGHADDVFAVSFSQDSRQLASASRDGTIKIWDIATGRCFQTIQSRAWILKFSSDSHHLASSTYEGDATIWDSKTGQATRTFSNGAGKIYTWLEFSDDLRLLALGAEDGCVKIIDTAEPQNSRTLEGPAELVWPITFSHDSRLVAASFHHVVKIWETATGRDLQTLKNHATGTSLVAFSHDSRQLAFVTVDNRVKIWGVETAENLWTLEGHTDEVNSIAFSYGSQYVASGSADATAKIWNVASGKLLRTLGGHGLAVNSVAFLQDARLATASADATVKIWDSATGRLIRTLNHDQGLNAVAFSCYLQQLASASVDGRVKMWDTVMWQCLRCLDGHFDSISSISFSYNAQYFATASADTTVNVWDATSGRLLRTLKGHDREVNSVAFSQDSQNIVSASADGTVKLWNGTKGSCFKTLICDAPTNSVAFSHDSKLLVFASVGGTVKSWDMLADKYSGDYAKYDPSFVTAFSHDSRLFASASYGGTIRLWDLATARCLKTLATDGYQIESLDFSYDSRQLAAAGSENIYLWEVATCRCLRTLKGHSGTVNSIAFSRSLQLLASASSDRTIKVWNTVIDRPLYNPASHTSTAVCVTFSPNMRQLASVSEDVAIIWNVRTGQPFHTLKHSHWDVISVEFSPDSQRLLVSSGKQVRVWDVSTGECLRILEGHTFRGRSAFSPDSQNLATVHDGVAKVWKLDTVDCGKMLEDHMAEMSWVVFTADSRRVATNSANAVVIRDTATGISLQTLKGRTSHTFSATFSPDSRLLAIGSFVGVVFVWDVEMEECIWELVGHRNTVTSVAFSPNMQRLASASSDRSVKIWDVFAGLCILSLYVGAELYHVFFHPTESQLLTEIGALMLDLDSATSTTELHGDNVITHSQRPHWRGYGLNPNRSWITYNGENVVWLPSEYRPYMTERVSVAGSYVVIGCGSGRVLLVGFSPEITPHTSSQYHED